MTKRTVKRVLECILLAILFVIFVFPFYWTLITSVKSTMEAIQFPPTLWPSKFVWSNYAEVWQGSNFAHYGKNSIITSVGATAVTIFFSVMAAYAFARYEFRFKKALFALSLADIMIPAQVIFLPIFVMYSSWGILNTYFSFIIIFIYSGSTIFFFRNAFMQVPGELIEAARLDGSSELSVMFKVMLPAVRPFLITQVMLSFMSKWNGYFWIQTLTTNEKIRTLPIAMNNLVNQTEDYVSRWDLSMAGSVILMAPLLILYIICNRQMKVAFIGNGIK